MKKLSLALVPFALAISIPALIHAQTSKEPDWSHLMDLHLDVIPRTKAEVARITATTAPPTDATAALPFEENSGGAGTVRPRMNADAFSQPLDNLSFEDELNFRVGNGLFRRLWVTPPASTLASDGLGPLYNARSCQRCHLKDGRGHPPEGPGDTSVSMFLRISISGPTQDAGTVSEITDYIATQGDPNYGTQLQDFSLPGHPAEYDLEITYDEIKVALSDGEMATLRRPTYTARNLGYGPLHDGAMFSPRVANQMIGLGLLEAIPVGDILAHADPFDADGDDISGRPQVVLSRAYDQPMLGRFGHKAGNPTIREQSAGAFAGDIGISNPLHPNGWGECTVAQVDCVTALHGDNPEQDGFEIDDIGLDLVTFYSQNLAVPARRDVDDPTVLKGREIFHAAKCASCHVPSYVTHRQADDSATSFQLIWPYTDLLLHDLGDGLADYRPEGRATGTEWRTAPLWGIGMTEIVSDHTYFLHDGRARNLLEAVLWHGGEAAASRDAVVDMPAADRAALIAFLESL